MKQIAFFALIVGACFWVSCNHQNNNESSGQSDSLVVNAKEPVIVVYNFYSTHRCPSCVAIEEATIKTLDSCFTQELKDGKIKRFSINVDEEANAKLSEKYQAFGSGLIITKVSNGNEMRIDLTGSGFKYALNKREKFIEILKTTLDSLLK